MEKFSVSKLSLQEIVPTEMAELVNNLFTNFTEGRYEFADGAFANAESYDTVCCSKFEAHRKMIDVQIVVSEQELIHFAPITNDFQISEAYDEKRDIEFMSGKVTDTVLLNPGEACIIGPEYAHMPHMAVNGSEHVQKIVLKIPVKQS